MDRIAAKIAAAKNGGAEITTPTVKYRREKDGRNNRNDPTTKRSGGMAGGRTNDQRNGRKGRKEITMVVVGWQSNNNR